MPADHQEKFMDLSGLTLGAWSSNCPFPVGSTNSRHRPVPQSTASSEAGRQSRTNAARYRFRVSMCCRSIIVRFYHHLVCLSLLAILSACGSGQGDSVDDTITDAIPTDHGSVSGFQDQQTMAYLGIPFAAPPVGPLRWQPPTEPKVWQGTRQATAFSPPCPQVEDNGAVIGNEDCLYLNVWKPLAASAGANLPVMVFVHGGGNTQGSASKLRDGFPLYDGQRLAERGQVVVVTLQYRLGALGFLVHPALAAESPQRVSGNYGLLDQIAALGWVQRNIHAFGGDPGRVLLLGQSAGALDTCMLVTSPLARGLFSRALMESGGCNAKSATERAAEGESLATTVGCDHAANPVACLRQLDATTLVRAVDTSPTSPLGIVKLTFGPNVDGYVLPVEPIDALDSGQHNPVPFVIGANADETSTFGIPITLTEYEYQLAARAVFDPAQADAVLARYPVSAYGSPRDALIAATTDAQFVCPARRIARAAANHQTPPVYRYFFTHGLSGPFSGLLEAGHGVDLLFVFQHIGSDPRYPPTAEDQALEFAMLGYWTRFAATGDPNGGQAVNWPQYVADADPYLELATPVRSGTGVRTAQCDFWDGLNVLGK
ncbi:MAG: carboxylesterase family protein [Candidatus Competibacteraceae bacterium]